MSIRLIETRSLILDASMITPRFYGPEGEKLLIRYVQTILYFRGQNMNLNRVHWLHICHNISLDNLENIDYFLWCKELPYRKPNWRLQNVIEKVY